MNWNDVDLIRGGTETVVVKEMFVEIEREPRKIGVNTNEDNTKCLTLARQQGSRGGQNITIDEYNFEVIQSFKYHIHVGTLEMK